ncbi:uncharacterized protein LAESUDRAFT_738508 [Laetiporus sulphureus 93-53]|uniref:Autophagy-related protein 13 n=1 Tax=Laetiporus sulphureus 93-53 TaxID=1314785 RepID=A0A165CHB2_9APHY|nr:uncharacterized protein LAESUDRAFT_738508 [Laetiporus sulphureus 93-53]KZT02810.1 hypothetical protein LAESUDRAFT_738508 [Laetiporus sulphureus 93-53]
MSNDTPRIDQIAHKFYAKLALVVNHARATVEPSPEAKEDRWFNLETPGPDILKDYTRLYRSISSAQTVPPFQLHVLLCVPELSNNQVLVYHAPDSSRLRIDPTPKYILLESWDILFAPTAHRRYGDDRAEVAPPTMYKHGILLFRSIFTLLRVLPAWRLARRLRRRTGGNRIGNLTIQLRVKGAEDDGGVLGFDMPPAPGVAPLAKDTHAFPPITHLTGTLTFSVTYLTTPQFQLDELESLLSSRFLSLDEGPEFTPTLVKHQQRDSLSGSPGSLPMRTSLPRTPPSSSVADRFVVPPAVGSRTTTFTTVSGSSPRLQSVALPSVRRLSNPGPGAAGSPSGISDGSSSRHGAGSVASRDDAVSAMAARLRRESIGRSRGPDLPSIPGPLPIRRSPITNVHPFKASTISPSPSLHSPSPSLRQYSPLSSTPGGSGPSLPSRPVQMSPAASRAGPMSARLPSSPVTPFRPSPPFAPSSLGDRRSLVSAEGVSISGSESPRMGGKRYSSSFGHRYAASGGVGSDGSGGSGVREAERTTGASFPSANVDDEEISAFMKDIDTRKPLGGLRERNTPSREGTPEEVSEASQPSRSASVASHTRTRSMPEPMLATEAAVDERLREMNEAFMTTIRGLDGRRRTRGGSTHAPRQPIEPVVAGSSVQQGTMLEGARVGPIGVPPSYVRPRLGSTASARSGLSVASGEVLGRMDPEIGDDREGSDAI